MFTEIFHADHGLDLITINNLAAEHCPAKEGFVIFSAPAPAGVESALYGPMAGDEPVTDIDPRVVFVRRGDRPGPSKLIEAPARPATHVIIIGVLGGTCFTAYGQIGDRPTPREWWDSSMSPTEAIQSATFWSQHALACDKASLDALLDAAGAEKG